MFRGKIAHFYYSDKIWKMLHVLDITNYQSNFSNNFGSLMCLGIIATNIPFNTAKE